LFLVSPAHFPHLINILRYLSQLPLILTLYAVCLLAPVLGEETATLGAGLGEGLAIGGEGTFWVVATAVEGALLFTRSL